MDDNEIKALIRKAVDNELWENDLGLYGHEIADEKLYERLLDVVKQAQAEHK